MDYEQAEVLNSAYKVTENSESNIEFGALQLALNGKIYIAQCSFDTIGSVYNESHWPGSYYLHSIEDPNESGALCNFQDSSVYLGTGKSAYGLPNFVASTLKQVDFEIKENTGCKDEKTVFNIEYNNASFDSVHWNFGVGNAGSTEFSPSYIYTSNGQYYITLTVHDNCKSYNVHKQIEIIDRPDFKLINDTTLCVIDSITLKPNFQ